MIVDNLTLMKRLGKGSFGEVFLTSKKGSTELFATKKMDRKYADSPGVRKYFINEISILKEVSHPNIVRLDQLKQTKDHYYIVMEYCNGGSLTECLNNYKKLHGKPFTEEIVQYLMRQIVDAIKYLHNRKIIHRDLKLDNILVKFNNDMDKNQVNMMKAQVKIIDFGFAIHLTSKNMAFSALGSPINMDPVILKKLNKRGGTNALGYDEKADIWSLGTICYEMLIGQAVFNAESMNDLVRKVERGSYIVPTSLSREVVSFLNGMLQYDSKLRFSASELAKHHFLTKRVSDFSSIDLGKNPGTANQKVLSMNTRKNRSIWAVFNEENEKKLINIPKNLNQNTIEEKNTNMNNNYNLSNNQNQKFVNNNQLKKAKTTKNEYINNQYNYQMRPQTQQYNTINYPMSPQLRPTSKLGMNPMMYGGQAVTAPLGVPPPGNNPDAYNYGMYPKFPTNRNYRGYDTYNEEPDLCLMF